MLWIISGPSSAGKSTFLQSARGAELTGLPAATPVIWPRTQSQFDEVGTGDAFYHYNLLRPQFLDHRLARQARRQGQPAPAAISSFSDDPPWQGLLKRALPKRAVVLVTSKPTLLQRIAERTDVEDPDFSGREHKQYQTQLWQELIEQADLPALYQAWCQTLDAAGIPYLLVSGEDSSYPVIADAEAAAIAGRERDHRDRDPDPDAAAASAGSSPNAPPTPYTKERIVAILRERRFGYHRVELPFGLATRGEDRGSTRDLVLPESLAGKSVLDVGCALGYFCFEAEARAAARVLGADLRQSRLEDALLLKEIKGSRVEFILRDVVGQPLTERFDHILLLNVIHHLTEPFRAMRHLLENIVPSSMPEAGAHSCTR